MGSVATLTDVISVLDGLYPPSLAADWDAVGLVCGDPEQPIETVLLAVDTVRAVADDARELGADLVIAHHPLFLRAVHGIPTSDPKGRLVTDLIRSEIALFVAHTNADVPPGGVSDAFASALGLTGRVPLVPMSNPPLDKLVVFVPVDHRHQLINALAAIGAGRIGEYDRAAFFAPGTGTFRPSPNARPFIGAAGEVEEVAEERVEMVVPRDRRRAAVAAIQAAHPYEEPAFDVVELAPAEAGSSETGLGRLGQLAVPASLGSFAATVARTLPQTASVVRIAGDLDREVRTIAVQGGAGDDLFDVVRAHGADVYVTSDLRHHPALEAREYDEGPALIDVPHWAAEWTWLPVLRDRLQAGLSTLGRSVKMVVSERSTDPWNDVRPIGSSPSSSGETGTADVANMRIDPRSQT